MPCPKGGKITIEISNVGIGGEYAARYAGSQPGAHVMLSVTDTGRGMDATTKARIFEPLFATKEFGKGTRLGLSTVYGIVKQSGGSVWVYSELGIGSTFTIYLPCVDSVLEIASPNDHVERVRGGSQAILIVEDEAALPEVTHQSLKELGYATLSARRLGGSHPYVRKSPGSNSFDVDRHHHARNDRSSPRCSSFLPAPGNEGAVCRHLGPARYSTREGQMQPSQYYEIFQKPAAKEPTWIETVIGAEALVNRVKQLSQAGRGDYFVLERGTIMFIAQVNEDL
jgi:hypothetical protein